MYSLTTRVVTWMKFHLPKFQVLVRWSRDRCQIGKNPSQSTEVFVNWQSSTWSLRTLQADGSSRAIESTWLNLGQIGASFSAPWQLFSLTQNRVLFDSYIWVRTWARNKLSAQVASRVWNVSCCAGRQRAAAAAIVHLSSLTWVKRRRLNSDSTSNRFISNGSAVRIDPDPLLSDLVHVSAATWLFNSPTLTQRRVSFVRKLSTCWPLLNDLN